MVEVNYYAGYCIPPIYVLKSSVKFIVVGIQLDIINNLKNKKINYLSGLWETFQSLNIAEKYIKDNITQQYLFNNLETKIIFIIYIIPCELYNIHTNIIYYKNKLFYLNSLYNNIKSYYNSYKQPKIYSEINFCKTILLINKNKLLIINKKCYHFQITFQHITNTINFTLPDNINQWLIIFDAEDKLLHIKTKIQSRIIKLLNKSSVKEYIIKSIPTFLYTII